MFKRVNAFVGCASLMLALATGSVFAQDKMNDKMPPGDSMEKMQGDQMNDQGKVNGKKKMKHKKGKMQDKDKMGGKMGDSTADKMEK